MLEGIANQGGVSAVDPRDVSLHHLAPDEKDETARCAQLVLHIAGDLAAQTNMSMSPAIAVYEHRHRMGGID